MNFLDYLITDLDCTCDVYTQIGEREFAVIRHSFTMDAHTRAARGETHARTSLWPDCGFCTRMCARERWEKRREDQDVERAERGEGERRDGPSN